jgi:hypothetical protein
LGSLVLTVRQDNLGKELKSMNYFDVAGNSTPVDDLENSDRLGFIGKEVDNENMLGDFGVRKYSSEMGMFTIII